MRGVREVFHATNDDPEPELAIHRMREHVRRLIEAWNISTRAWTPLARFPPITTGRALDHGQGDGRIRAARGGVFKGGFQRGFWYVGETFVYREEIDAHEFSAPSGPRALRTSSVTFDDWFDGGGCYHRVNY